MQLTKSFLKLIIYTTIFLFSVVTAQDLNGEWLLLRTPRAEVNKSLIGRYFYNGEFRYASSTPLAIDIRTIAGSQSLIDRARTTRGGNFGTELKQVINASISQSGVVAHQVNFSKLTIYEPENFYDLDFVPGLFPERLVTALLAAENLTISFSEQLTGEAKVEVEQAISELLPVTGEVSFSEKRANIQTGSNLIIAIRTVSVLGSTESNSVYVGTLNGSSETYLIHAAQENRKNGPYIASVRQASQNELEAIRLDGKVDIYCLRVEVRHTEFAASQSRYYCPKKEEIRNIEDGTGLYVPNISDSFSDQLNLPSLSVAEGQLGQRGSLQTFLNITPVSVEIDPNNPTRISRISMGITLREKRFRLVPCPWWGYIQHPLICIKTQDI